MRQLPDFQINSDTELSKLFLQHNLDTYHKAAEYIKNLPYGRNSSKKDLTTVFTENCGTCSTKHAILKQLADDHGKKEIKLMMGIFKMDASYAPVIAPILEKHNLPYIPEAHNYLMYNRERIDFTTPVSNPEKFETKLLKEKAISTEQIDDYKVAYHKDYLSTWISANMAICMSMEEIWNIRETCIKALINK